MRAAILALSFLLFAFAAGLVPKVAATAAPEPVLDVTGKILRTGTSYYILPVVRGRGGGLKMASTGRRTCPLAVVQERYEASNGLPLKLTPVNTKKDLNIRFSAASICHQSTAWKLDNYDEWTKQWFVTTNGVEGNPGPETTNNWFKIEKFEDKYKLVFCPTVCQHCKVMCKDIGIFVDAKGVRRLALSSVPLKVMFKKA
ncbi:kunitz trypsin inhibitor 5-like [Populus alba x Populus x berolinensis]|nr:kunitz trypsin inhibitor 5-like [Populus alba x Populus x berolinensis]